MADKLEIWREKKSGKRRGRHVRWDEDCYRISRRRLEKKTVPRTTTKTVKRGRGKAVVESQVKEVVGSKVDFKGDPIEETGLVFDEKLVPVLDEAGAEVFDVIFEGLVNDSFIQHNGEAYKTFIEQNGERKDERYRTTN